ncbi:30206_t:CDS:2 [Gigaspora margarita]|uniref:30206_t:CDS:1 n=1 Tax=Gigaspora margarita TaxID=4874 RepID=A0ABN7UYT8_GIGMA|nr:30206_t:CDS:2 [Gigaspora margarita]
MKEFSCWTRKDKLLKNCKIGSQLSPIGAKELYRLIKRFLDFDFYKQLYGFGNNKIRKQVVVAKKDLQKVLASLIVIIFALGKNNKLFYPKVEKQVKLYVLATASSTKGASFYEKLQSKNNYSNFRITIS